MCDGHLCFTKRFLVLERDPLIDRSTLVVPLHGIYLVLHVLLILLLLEELTQPNAFVGELVILLFEEVAAELLDCAIVRPIPGDSGTWILLLRLNRLCNPRIAEW